jgi:hypothetical protein
MRRSYVQIRRAFAATLRAQAPSSFVYVWKERVRKRTCETKGCRPNTVLAFKRTCYLKSTVLAMEGVLMMVRDVAALQDTWQPSISKQCGATRARQIPILSCRGQTEAHRKASKRALVPPAILYAIRAPG